MFTELEFWNKYSDLCKRQRKSINKVSEDFSAINSKKKAYQNWMKNENSMTSKYMKCQNYAPPLFFYNKIQFFLRPINKLLR